MRNFHFHKIIFVSFFLFISIKVFSQRFNAGITGGAIASQVSGDELAGYNKSGFEIGGLVSIALSEKFDLAFQIAYIQKGSRKPINADQLFYDYYKLRLGYIQVPFLLKYNFSKKIMFEAGMGIATLLSSSEEDNYGIIPENNRPPFRKIELTTMGTMGYELFDNFLLLFGIENSVLPIRKYEPGFTHLHLDQYNTLLRFSFRYYFKKKHET